MKTTYLNILLFLCFCSTTNAQEVIEPVTNSMEKLHFMLGTWEGKAWMMTPNGKVDSKVKEQIYCKTDCNIMVAEGLGTKIDPKTNKKIVVHNAFGVMYIDAETKVFKLRAYKDNKISISDIDIISEKTIRWSMEVPNQGTVRFTSDYSKENTWIEVGEFSRDGENWIQFLGMELTKTQD